MALGGSSGLRPIPATLEEALEIGRMHFPPIGSPGGPVSLFVHEFDVGYLIRAGWPVPEHPGDIPMAPGGGNIAISKIDGDVAFLPNFPPESAIALYRRSYRPGSP
ncbi:hypothetical protein ACIHFE_33150 [Streptomyces sp. NPDC052396]|uniref:hypothetical protein n=1 Tax=Streptomyces sp. NPDC052396 TaxID=3365689 RepID=UPI0037D6CD34